MSILIKNIAIWLILFFPSLSYGKIYINIGSPKIKKSVIAITPFILNDIKPNRRKVNIGQDISKYLNKNLNFSSYFKILPREAFIENPSEISPLPYPKDPKGFRWVNWKLSGADFLFFGSYSIKNSKLSLNVSFYNINSQTLIFRKKYTAKISDTKSLVDTLSNDIVKKLSGRRGVFNTKIISTRSTSGTKKELFIMNWDGSSQKRLSYHRSIVLSPSWFPDGKKVAYTVFVYNTKFKKRMTALLLLDLVTNKIKLLSNRNGANLGSDFFPNGKEMLLTLGAGSGNMDIFKMNLSSSSIKSLTKGPRGIINVEPSIHPKSNLVAFSSDRKGKAMIYTMTKSGKNIKRITFAGHYNSTPDWNPQNHQMVFSGQSGGRFDIFKINSNGSGLKRLTSLKKSNGRWANCESPSFSPDGRFIVFTSDLSGTYQLYIMNVDDLSIERITFDRYNYKSPKWSPYL